jgi:hypothetical protein
MVGHDEERIKSRPWTGQPFIVVVTLFHPFGNWPPLLIVGISLGQGFGVEFKLAGRGVEFIFFRIEIEFSETWWIFFPVLGGRINQ